MAHHGESGGSALDEDDRDFLRTCAEEPETVDPDELFALVNTEAADVADDVGEDEDPETVAEQRRKLGARGLTQFAKAAPGRLTEHTDDVLALLSAEDDDVRGSAIMVTQRLVEADVDAFAEPPVEPLIDRLGKEDQPGSKRVAQILVKLLDAEDPRLAEATDRTVDLFGGDKHEAGSAIQALVVLGEAYPEPILDRLLTRLTDDEPDVRKYSVRTVASLAEANPDRVAASTTDLIALLEDEDAYTLEHTLSTLVTVAQRTPADVEPAVPDLVELVDAEHDKVRRGAVRILAELGRADVELTDVVATLRGRLDDADKIVRRDATYALGILRAEDVLEDLEALTEADDLELQAVAESAVERITEGESDPPMAELDPGEIFTARL